MFDLFKEEFLGKYIGFLEVSFEFNDFVKEFFESL